MPKTTRKPWFAVRLLYANYVGGKKVPDLIEDRIVLIRARHLAEATKRAKVIGEKGEHSYENVFKRVVSWRLAHILEVQELTDDSVSDETEVYYRLFSSRKPKEYLKFLEFKVGEIAVPDVYDPDTKLKDILKGNLRKQLPL